MFQATVGQEVAIVRNSSGFYGFTSATYAKVAKINGFGHIILDNGKKFDKFGYEYKGTKYHCCYLADADQTRAQIAEQNAKRDLNNNVRKVVDDFNKIINNNKNGMGQYFISAETKAELVALINQLPVNS